MSLYQPIGFSRIKGWGQKKAPKYLNQKTQVGAQAFDSKKEAQRFLELQMLERAGKIQDLRTQVVYELQEGFRHGGGAALPPHHLHR